MNVDDLRDRNLLLLECVSGSRAYGLDTAASDTDIKGIFILPKSEYYGLNYIEQISDASNNQVFYELGRFMELLSVNNPNILELLASPQDTILYKHEALNVLHVDRFLSKLCHNTFGRFAMAQIKKAKGLKKKIVNPVSKERKSVFDFCYVNHKQGAIPVLKFLELKGWDQRHCGLADIPHMNDVYGLYYSVDGGLGGIVRGEDSNDVCLSQIPKGMQPEALLFFNRNAYSVYCREYREYWEWVDNRNEERYANTVRHGKNYDAKNMMHVFRLLDMAIEIGRDKQINVRRPNRDFLLEVRSGKYEYNDLLEMAEVRQREMDTAFEHTSLPVSPDPRAISDLTSDLRQKLYSGDFK